MLFEDHASAMRDTFFYNKALKIVLDHGFTLIEEGPGDFTAKPTRANPKPRKRGLTNPGRPRKRNAAMRSIIARALK